MRILIFVILSIFMFSTASFAQKNSKVKIHIHKQTGNMYFDHQLNQEPNKWLKDIPKYIFKQTADTVFYYIDEIYNTSSINDRVKIIETQNLGKKVDIGILRDIEGNVIYPKMLENKVIVINIWGTWCPPCIKEIPELNRLTESYSGKDVVFIAPTARSDEEKVKSFIETRAFYYQIVPNGDELAAKFTMHYPTNVVIDKNGIVRFVKVGYDSSIFIVLSSEIDQYL